MLVFNGMRELAVVIHFRFFSGSFHNRINNDFCFICSIFVLLEMIHIFLWNCVKRVGLLNMDLRDGFSDSIARIRRGLSLSRFIFIGIHLTHGM